MSRPHRLHGPTSGAIVLSYPELVQVLGVSQGELVVVGVDRLLAVLHVDPQLIATLGGHLLDVVQSLGVRNQGKGGRRGRKGERQNVFQNM